jgi:tetratricopeptide (TPR) repeat protein
MNRLARYKGQFMFDVKGKSVDDAKEALAKEPNSATAHVTMALAFARAHKMDEAKGEIAAALKIDPNDKNAHYMAAKIAGASDDPKGALAHLQAIQRAGGDGYGIEMQIADIDEALKDKAGMKTALETAYRWDPTQSDALKGIYDLAHEEKRDGDELYALRKLAPIEQHDRRIWRRLLATLVDKKLWNEARKVGESAIFVDVENIEIHTNYARALQATGAHDKAIYELESAVLCEGKPPELATAHALLAKSALATGDRARAKTELDAALQLDPANDEAKGVKL